MHFRSLLLAFASIFVSQAHKFLVYSPQFAVSHVNYLGNIADALVEAGNEVVILAPRVDPGISGARSKKANVIEIAENEHGKRWNQVQVRTMDLYWNSSALTLYFETRSLFDSIHDFTNVTMNHPGLIDQLKAEKFDVGISEDPAGFGLFHLLGLEKTALALSFGSFECNYGITQAPSNPAYVPAFFSQYGDRMSFFERVVNSAMCYTFGYMMRFRAEQLHPIFERLQPGLPYLGDLIADASLVFLNSEPLLDYPRPTVHRMIDIGGIVTPIKAVPVEQYWDDVLNRRSRSVILSFGTYIKASAMPDSYKITIRETLRKFEDVTFIWKYESPEHNVSGDASNIVVTQWLPQVDILNDKRLTAFITHGGQGSTLEAAYAGVPMLMVPTQGDQFRNAAMIKRAGLGEIVHLSALERGDELEKALRNLLEHPMYKAGAMRTAKMLRDRPFSAKQTLVRNMEFLAAYGPLRMLEHEGRKLGWMEYYLVDVFLFLGLAFCLTIGLVCTCTVIGCKYLCSRTLKKKTE